MKKLLIIVILSLTFAGCTSTIPYFYSDTSAIDYEILGEVEYKGKYTVFLPYLFSGGASYKKLLQEAKRKYNNADYVVNVTVDVEKTWLIIAMVYVYHMRGTAVRYKQQG